MASGNLGRKTKRGIYEYDGRGKKTGGVNAEAVAILARYRIEPVVE